MRSAALRRDFGSECLLRLGWDKRSMVVTIHLSGFASKRGFILKLIPLSKKNFKFFLKDSEC